MNPQDYRTVVEVVERTDENNVCVKVSEVRVNGQRVRVLHDGININYDTLARRTPGDTIEDGIVSVQLTLLVDDFRIHRVGTEQQAEGESESND